LNQQPIIQQAQPIQPILPTQTTQPATQKI